MGCSIHLHIEVKIDHEWRHYGAPSIEKWYKLFGKMAGVRDTEVHPISLPKGLPKGLPKDISRVTFLSARYWEDDGHSYSWLGKEEIGILSEWLRHYANGDWLHYDLEGAILHTYLEGNSFEGNLPEGIDDVRFVFWFDN